jgi:hypothetical protein
MKIQYNLFVKLEIINFHVITPVNHFIQSTQLYISFDPGLN